MLLASKKEMYLASCSNWGRPGGRKRARKGTCIRGIWMLEWGMIQQKPSNCTPPSIPPSLPPSLNSLPTGSP